MLFGNKLDSTFQDFILSDEISNEGMRIFNSSSILVDPHNKIITFTAKKDEKYLGVPDFLTRTELTEELIKLYSTHMGGLDTENKIYNFTNNKNIKEPFHPETGGALAISNICLYRDPSGEIFVPVPLSRPNANYALEGKTSRASLLGGAKLPNLNKIKGSIDPRSKKQEINTLILLGEKNKKDRFLKKKEELKLGEWTVRMQSEDKNIITEIDNCVVGRGPEGTFEAVKIDAFQSIESVLKHFKISENIGYERPVCLIKLSDLMHHSRGDNIDVQEIFYKGEKLKNISNLEEGFKGKFDIHNNTTQIKDFSATYPFQLFLDNIFNLISAPEIKKVLDIYIKKVEAVLENDHLKKYEMHEKLFGERFNIDDYHNNAPINPIHPIKYSIDEIKGIISNSNYDDQSQKNMLVYLNKTKDFDSTTLEIDPDYVIPTSNGNIIIEYKNSKNAYKNTIKQRTRKDLFMLLYPQDISKYITVIDNTENSEIRKNGENQYIISSLALKNLGLYTQDATLDFLTHIDTYI